MNRRPGPALARAARTTACRVGSAVPAAPRARASGPVPSPIRVVGPVGLGMGTAAVGGAA